MTTSVDPEGHETRAPVPLTSLVEEWVAAGVVSPEQALRMTSYADEMVTLDRPQPDPHGRRASTVAMEALGYIGGVVVLVSSILIMNLYWRDLSDGVRATVVALASAALLAAGFATSARPVYPKAQISSFRASTAWTNPSNPAKNISGPSRSGNTSATVTWLVMATMLSP